MRSPSGTAAARTTRPGQRRLELVAARAPQDLAAGGYTVGTPAGDGPILFRLVITDARRSLDVMVGACNQWYDETDVMVVGYPARRSRSRVELLG